jgi:hypothetical protein
MRRAVTPVLRRRSLPHLAGSRCLPNPESSPWSLYSGAGLLRGGEGVHSSDDGDSLRTVDPHRFSRNRYLPLTFPAHRTTSAHADVGKRSGVAEPGVPGVSSCLARAMTGRWVSAEGPLGPQPATLLLDDGARYRLSGQDHQQPVPGLASTVVHGVWQSGRRSPCLRTSNRESDGSLC